MAIFFLTYMAIVCLSIIYAKFRWRSNCCHQTQEKLPNALEVMKTKVMQQSLAFQEKLDEKQPHWRIIGPKQHNQLWNEKESKFLSWFQKEIKISKSAKLEEISIDRSKWMNSNETNTNKVNFNLLETVLKDNELFAKPSNILDWILEKTLWL